MDETKSLKQSQRIMRIALLIFFVLLSCLVLLPFYAVVLASFKPGRDLIRYGLNLKLDLDVMSFSNYTYLFTGDHGYFTWFSNSMINTVLQVAATLFISAMVGYGISKYKFRLQNVIFTCVILIMMVPFEILMLPLYTQAISMKLINTRLGIFLPFVANASNIFFFRQYLLGIPSEIIQAGRVDGATEYGIYFKLIVPIMKPAFAAMGILSCMGAWNNFLWPMLVLREAKMFTLPIGLNTLLTPYGNNYDLLIAGSCFSIIPIFVLFMCFQKYFIDGLTAGSVKG